MKKHVIWTVIASLLFTLQLAAQVLMAAVVLKLNVLPQKYVVAMVLLLVLFGALTGVLLFLHGKKPAGAARRIIACLLALLIAAGCGVAAKLVSDAQRTGDAVTGKVTTTVRNVYVFVPLDDPAQILTDAAGYTFGYVEGYDVRHTQQAIAQIEETLGKAVPLTAFTQSSDMAKALFDGSVDAVIMNGASVALLLEEEDYADFAEKIRILETLSFAQLEETEPTEPPETTQPEIPKTVTNSPFAVYISGSDTRSSKLTVSRSDVNILVIVNPVTKQILLLNTPRDYYVANPEGGGAMDKLTHCGLYGPECSMKVLGDLYGIDVDFYGQINFTGFETLVDAVGGITVYSDQSFKAGNTYISAGNNELNGSQALDFARERYRVSGGDRGRGNNQMKVVKAVIEKMTSGTTIISNYSAILASLEGMFSTSMEMEDISMLVKMQLEDMAKWNIQTFSVNGVGGSEKTYSMPGSYAYVMYEDKNITGYASELIQRVYAGEILTEEDMVMPQK